MTAVAAVAQTPGLEAYLGEIEDRLAAAAARYPGVVASAGADALAGGKRLRPLLVFLATPVGAQPHVVRRHAGGGGRLTVAWRSAPAPSGAQP
jgi:geranylgeranyl pyrophosphate synthase